MSEKVKSSEYHEKRVYKVDNEFRPSGRVFLKAQNPIPVPERKSSLKMLVPKAPQVVHQVTSSSHVESDKNVSFRHEVLHEKQVEATVTDYGGSPYDQFRSGDFQSLPAIENTGSSQQQVVHHHQSSQNGLQEVTRNKRSSTDVVGSSFETTKRSARGDDGRGRVMTQIVRRVTTMSRAEEQVLPDNSIKLTKDVKTTELGYMAGGPGGGTTQKRQRVKLF